MQPAAAHELFPEEQLARLQAEKCFFRRTCRRKKRLNFFRRWSGEILRSYFAFFRNKKRLTRRSAVFLFVRCTCCRPINTRRADSSVIRRSSDSYLWALMAPAVFPAFPERTPVARFRGGNTSIHTAAVPFGIRTRLSCSVWAVSLTPRRPRKRMVFYCGAG